MRIENVIKKFKQEEIYRCPKCSIPAKIADKSIVCEVNHRYDFSKKGYIHLINNYTATKYSEELFEARKIIFEEGFYKPVLDKVAGLLEKYANDVILDIGCGEGYYIRELKEIFPKKYFYGLDNSKDAIELAVKMDKNNPYMLANLANLPFRDNSVSCILNILTPANYSEFFRVIKDKGVIIKVIPTSEYLKEIRQIVGKMDYKNDETIKLIGNTAEIVEKINVSKTYKLTEEIAAKFLRMTPLTFSKDISKEDIAALKSITIDLDILVCRKK